MGHGKSRLIDTDHGWIGMAKAAKELKKQPKVKVGVLADDRKGGLHHKGRDGKSAKLTVAEIAAILEWGTHDGKQPARPALGPAFDEFREELAKMGKTLMSAVLLCKMDIDTALGIMGAFLANKTKLKISGSPLPGIGPPNSKSYAVKKLAKGKRSSKEHVFEMAASPWLGEKNHAYDKKTGKEVDASMLVRTWVDTGRVLNAFTWAIDKAKEEGDH